MTEGPHLSQEEISAAAEGLPAGRQRQAEAHLTGCEECRTARDQVAEVRALLRVGGQQPPAMPDAVSDRLLAAITAEARRLRAVPETTTPATGLGHDAEHGPEGAGDETVVPLTPRRRSATRALRALGAAAAVAAFAVGGTLGYQHLFTESPSSTATDPGRSTAPDRRPGESTQPPKVRQARGYAIAGAPDLTAKGFRGEVAAAVQPATRGTGKSPGEDPGMQPMMSDRCPAHAVAGAGGGVVLDQASATFDGRPADLVIARSPVSGAVEAYVVTGCPGGGTVTHHRTVPLSR